MIYCKDVLQFIWEPREWSLFGFRVGMCNLLLWFCNAFSVHVHSLIWEWFFLLRVFHVLKRRLNFLFTLLDFFNVNRQEKGGNKNEPETRNKCFNWLQMVFIFIAFVINSKTRWMSLTKLFYTFLMKVRITFWIYGRYLLMQNATTQFEVN